MIPRRSMLKRGAVALAVMATVAAGAVAPAFAQDTDLSALTGDITSDGSSTVGPITQAVAEEFSFEAPRVRSSVDISGTGGGFKRFCAGEIDIQNASRPIKDEEIQACADAGVEFHQVEVAYDGLSIVVNPAADFVECLSIEQLHQLWKKDAPAMTWADLNPEWPADTVNLYGPGTDSGTFDYFVEAVLGEDDIREDFTPSEDDNVLVEGVAGDANALGYFGYAYYAENQDSLRVVPIDGGDGCVEPSPETIQDGTYAPLSRPLFIYVTDAALQRPEVQEFMRFYVANAAELAADVGFIASPDATYEAAATQLEDAIAGNGGASTEATPGA